MNLRIALTEVLRRMNDIKLQPGALISYHSTAGGCEGRGLPSPTSATSPVRLSARAVKHL
jgi:hypothetical protein